MAHLIDTSVLARLANTAGPFYAIATSAVVELHRRGEALHVTSQVLIEFRSVATRPANVNGLGLPAVAAEAKAAVFEAAFLLLEETPAIYREWKVLTSGLGIIGKQVHDARLVAVCRAHAVTNLLTFNVSHFARMAAFVPGIHIADPAGV